MRRLLHHLGIISLVWLRLYNNKLLLRTVWRRNGESFAFGHCYPPMFWNMDEKAVKLLNGGKIAGNKAYIYEWFPYENKPPRPEQDKPKGWLSPFRERVR